MLYGYGGFDISEVPRFRPDVPAFLESGGVYATANMRGGGEYGEVWHEAGMFEKKQNVFDDFIAAAEYLVKERYASPADAGHHGRIERRSAGWRGDGAASGPLRRGAARGRRDGHAALSQVHRAARPGQPSTDRPTIPKAFAYLFKYSPLHNLKPGTCYPATLVVTADHDDRVVPSHSFKFAATLQAAQGCNRPTLIRVETQGSHGYRPTDKRIAELADEWAFALANMKPRSPSTAVR